MDLTLSELKTKLRADTHPQDLPENLVGPYDRIVAEGLTILQKWVDCLQQNNTQLYKHCSTYWDCNATVVEAPKGRIKRVYTVQSDQNCDKVYYRQISYARLLCLAKDYGLTEPPDQTGAPTLESPFYYANDSTDRTWGRSRYGFYAIQRGRLYVFPYIHSSETVVVEWDGMKRDWQDADLVSADPEFYRAIKLYVAKEMARDYDNDTNRYQTMTLEYREALRDLIHECREETRVRETEICDPDLCCSDETCLSREAATATPPDTEFVFANIGDWGNPDNGTAMTDVANLVKSWNPLFIVTNGDNIYAPASEYAVVTEPYEAFITDDITTNRFWPSLGNHDHNDASLADYQAFFTLPNNERYYSITRYGIEFFIYHTAKNNVGATSPEPDGVAAGSIQAEWLRLMLAASVARWKVVIIHDPPYTEHTPDYPGHTELRLPFASWGAHAVISGDAHGYFRYTVDDIPYIVNGLGGAVITSLQATPNANDSLREIRYIENYGAIKGTVSCDTLSLEFINILGDVIDTVTLTHPDA
jgi:tartrate-resistant acid phosphatase type 5